MKIRSTLRAFRAFTLVELIAMAGVMVLMIAVVMPALRPRHRGATRIKCVNNLKNVGLAFRIFATDHNDRFPFELSVTNAGTRELHAKGDPFHAFQVMSNEISTPKIVICPNDNRLEATNWINFSNQNVSYFVSPDSMEMLPQSPLSGDRNILINGVSKSGILRAKYDAQLTWDQTIHTNQGNMCMGDGSVQQLSNARLREQMRNTGRETNWVTTFLFP